MPLIKQQIIISLVLEGFPPNQVLVTQQLVMLHICTNIEFSVLIAANNMPDLCPLHLYVCYQR